MLKNIFILWIILQLVAIGWTSASVHNQIVTKTYICKSVLYPSWIGMFCPLAYFIPDGELEKYCK